MQVSRIEVFGFKSFMERIVLPLEGGITGVVGPNGCGKSNIVDALRWVLGETRAKSLRGSLLEDVIFNGTDKLRPLGLAEVTITLRASNENFFADLVSPALEAELLAESVVQAESEERAQNGADDSQTSIGEEAATVLQDSDEGAAQTADSSEAARPALRVIEGNLGREDGDKSGEEPIVPTEQQEPQTTADDNAEEEDSEDEGTTLESSSATVSASMLHRFSWLKSCSEVQVTRRLYRSGESEFFINRVQCRLKDVKELFRAVGLGPRAYTIVAQGEVARLITAKPEERRSILEEAAGVQGFRDKIAASQRRLAETDVNISRIDDILKEVTRQVNSLKRQASKAKNRQRLKDELHALDVQLYRDSYFRTHQQTSGVDEEIDAQKQAAEEADAAFHAVKAEEESARNDLMAIDVAGDELRNKIDAIKEELNARARQRSEKLARIAELEAFRQARETEIRRLAERKETLAKRMEESSASLEEFKLQEKALSEKVAAMDLSGEAALKDLARTLDALRADFKSKERDFRAAREELIAKQTSLESIEEQLIAASPVEQLGKSLQNKDFESLRALCKDSSLLIDGVEVPEAYAKALQAVLAERAAFLLADDHREIARTFVELAATSKDKGLGIGVFSKSVRPLTAASAQVPFPTLLSKLGIAPDIEATMSRLLHNVFYSEEVSAAFDFFDSAQGKDSGAIVVSASGAIITAESFYSLQHDGGVVQLKQRADALRLTVRDCKERVASCEAERDALSVQIEETEKQHSTALREFQVRQTEARELNNQLGNIRGRLHAEERVVSQVEQDEDRLAKQVREANNSIEQYGQEIVNVRAAVEAMTSDDESAMHAELRTFNEQYMALDEQRSAGRKALGVVSQKVSQIRGQLDSARSKVSAAELKQQKAALERQHAEERIEELFGNEFLQALSQEEQPETLLEANERAEIKDAAGKIRARIMREGEVDPTSIERLEEEQERLDSLTNQRDDLRSAAETLEKTIATLTETSVKRFLTTFEAVQKNFAELVPRLFGGGKGSIELIDPSAPLETGVEIVARPPGKKLKNIELLSGGEKALCATALVFAMFKERPSPLCVLDEVDAPLDEANLMRFVSLVKDMSTTTQFIMITHNKASMALSDKLVGVTMPEPGASRIISVSLQEAYEQVA